MAATIKNLCIRAIMGISVLAMGAATAVANVNPWDLDDTAAEASQQTEINSTNEVEVGPKRDLSGIAAGITNGAARGFSSGYNHVDALMHRGWLEPINPAAYPLEVKYEVRQRITFTKQASYWGIPLAELKALNPGFNDLDVLDPGIELTVLKRSQYSIEPQSVGPTNRGRIVNGWLMPEGGKDSGYFLRDERQRSYAAANTIRALMAGFAEYAAAYPGAPRINIGDLSKRRGGKIKPHASHQSGRDVDIGFVHKNGDEVEPRHFKRASSSNLDAEKTWYALKSIIATGEVKSIFLDINVQKMLYNVARKELDEKQLRAIFSYPHHSSNALMQHWSGHRDHAHIRFVCPENQPRCKR